MPHTWEGGTTSDLIAYIDEAGQRASTAKSSDHFILSAVIVEQDQLGRAQALLADLRRDLGRRRGDPLHWQNMKGHSLRLRAAQALGGAAGFLTISSVVVCKRRFAPAEQLPHEETAYLFTLRLLLERLSWFARDANAVLGYTLAHIVRFKLATLRAYEARLKIDPEARIEWNHLDPRGGRIDQPNRVEGLQLADIAASATLVAFEPDKFGNTERRYLDELSPALFRRPPGPITSYGLKMHPWNAATQALYAWVAEF